MLESNVKIGDTISNDFLNKWCSIDYDTTDCSPNKTQIDDWEYGVNNTEWSWEASEVIEITGKYVIIHDGNSFYCNTIRLDREEVEHGYKQEGYGKKV